MIKVYPYDKLGRVNHGWLDARHHFSFASYHNPERMQFGVLRVINDDIIAAGQGFAQHPHQNMEIITYVRKGGITHHDNLDNEGRTMAGDVQVMSAGSGVYHSEYNREESSTRLYQIWITPHTKQVQPRWDAKTFPKDPIQQGSLPLLVSGREEDKNKDALFIYQDAAIYGGKLLKNTEIKHTIKHQAYILASHGKFNIDNMTLQEGDGAEVIDLHEIRINAITDCELLIIDVPEN